MMTASMKADMNVMVRMMDLWISLAVKTADGMVKMTEWLSADPDKHNTVVVSLRLPSGGGYTR